MGDEKTPRDVGQDLVATIVSSYVKHNTISSNDLPTIIASVYQALSGLGRPAKKPAAVEVRRPVPH